MANMFVKDPNAILDYEWDWTSWLGTTETISASVILPDPGITVDSDTFASKTATVWLSGGTSGITYAVTNHITTSLGREDDRTIFITCQDSASLSVRSSVESAMVHRRGKVMIRVGFDGTTYDGTNADLTDSLTSAIRLLGGSIATRGFVTDADIATIPSEYADAINDATELYLIASVRGQMLDVDIVTGPFAAKLSQLAVRLFEDWKALKKKLEEDFGIGGIQAEVGVIEQNFAAHGDEDDTNV